MAAPEPKAPAPDAVAQAEERLKKIEAELGGEASKYLSAAELKAYLVRLGELRTIGNDCEGEVKQNLERIEGELAILSPEKPAEKAPEKTEVAPEKSKPTAPEGIGPESKEIEDKRRKLEQDKASLNARLATCRLVVFKSQDLTNRVTSLQQSILADRLRTLGPNLIEVVGSSIADAGRWWEVTKRLVLVESGVSRLGWYHAAGLGGAVLVGLGVGLFVRRRLQRASGRMTAPAEVSAGIAMAALTCAARYALTLGATVAATLYLSLLWWLVAKVPFLTELVYGLLLYFLVVVAIRVLLRPCRPAPHYLPLPEDVSIALARRLSVLALLALVGVLIFAVPFQEHLPEWLQLLSQDIYVAFLVLNLVWILWLIGRFDRWQKKRWLRLLLASAAVAALGAEWAGYRAFSQFVIIGVALTLTAFGVAFLTAKLLGEAFDGLEEGRHTWQQAVRRWVGVLPGEPVPGADWIRLLAMLLLWSAVVAVLLRIWGLSDQGFALVGLYLTDGFQVAGFKIVPTKILLAILVLALLLTVTRWIKGRLDRRWLTRLRIDRGVREALVTTSGYVGVTIAVLVALSVAGIEFTNVAIIAGALSVGIGFGLQNIVNNFVSGLILLIERPVKAGDFIVVGGTQGYVKRISIRSTQIQTQDRADIILPNSDLISAQVTNWMLNDPLGRIHVPVGVAYGTDTHRVRDILLRIANEHPDVIRGRPGIPEPRVLFLSFGDSALLFELRAFVRQIDRQFDVISDINFAVDAAFREEGIEIPFPQRDLHIKSGLGKELPSG